MKSRVLKKPRTRDPLRTRTKLLQATLDLVAAKGPHALSLKEAARRANLSRGVAYQYFKHRDHLLQEAKRWIAHRLADGVRQLQEASLGQRTLYSAKVVLNNPDATRLLFTDAFAGKDLRKTHRCNCRAFRDRMDLLLAQWHVRARAHLATRSRQSRLQAVSRAYLTGAHDAN